MGGKIIFDRVVSLESVSIFCMIWLNFEYLPEITILMILLQSTENRTDNPPVIILHSMVALEKFAQTSKFYTCNRKNPIYPKCTDRQA